jgi:membrane-bound serine protease (ClpP class)
MKRRPSLHRSYFLLAFIVVAALCASADVVKIKIDGPIHAITEEHLDRAIDRARQQNAEAVLIEIRTPGGLADATHNIVEKILSSPIPVIVYVSPSGARSASAGFYILEAADVAAMAPGTNTGSAHPVGMFGNVQGDMRAKVENDFAAWIRSYVPKRGRNVELAETAVRDSKSWSDQEALSQNLIDVVATDQNDLFKQLDGRTIKRFDGTSTTLHLRNKKVDEFPLTLRQQILGWMMDPNITFFILAIGAMALYAEFNHPGAIIPGVVGLIFIVLAIFALNLLPTRFAALALILAAFVLFALEAKYVSHGVLGTGGVIALTLGGLLLVDGPIPELRVKLWTALGVSVPLGLITIFLMTIALRARRNKITTGSQGLIGEIGTARTPLTPEGKVFVHGEIWDAHSTVPIQPGDAVVVRSVNGLHLVVEPATASARQDDLVRI